MVNVFSKVMNVNYKFFILLKSKYMEYGKWNIFCYVNIKYIL